MNGRLVAAYPDDVGRSLSASQAAAFTPDRIQAEGVRFYEVVWDGTRRARDGRYLAKGLVEPTRAVKVKSKWKQPIVSRLTAEQRQEVVRDVLSTGYQATGAKWKFSKFTVTMIMRKQGIKKRDQKRASC